MFLSAIYALIALNSFKFVNSYQKYYQSIKPTQEVCGCAPDAVIRTKYDTKAFMFKDEYFWLFDVFDNIESTKRTQILIADTWPGLAAKVNYGLLVFNKIYFVKDHTYWIFNDNRRKIKEGSIKNWTRFPYRADAAHVIYESKNFAIIELYSGCKVFRCNMTVNDDVFCHTGEYYRKLDKNERILGSIHASTTLKSKVRLIFGYKHYCIIFPGQQCIPKCNPKTFSCTKSVYSDIVVLIIVIAMIMLCLLFVSLFWLFGSSTRGI